MAACSGRWFRQPTHASPPAQPLCTCMVPTSGASERSSYLPTYLFHATAKSPLPIRIPCLVNMPEEGKGQAYTHTHTHTPTPSVFLDHDAERGRGAYAGSSPHRRGGLRSAVPRSVSRPRAGGLGWAELDWAGLRRRGLVGEGEKEPRG